jgi:P4 family phage/plasmid primase-like protien
VPISINMDAHNKVGKHQQRELQGGFQPHLLSIDEITSHILEGHAVSPALMDRDQDGKSIRKNSAFRQAQLVFLDIDNSVTVNGTKRRKDDGQGYVPWDRVINNKAVKDMAYLAYTTPSHTDDWHRFRIVFCLPAPVTDVNRYREIVKAFVAKLNADESCKAPVNIFYGNTKADIHPFGNILTTRDVDRILQWATNLQREERTAADHINGNLDVEYVREMLTHIPAHLDYTDWMRVVSGVASRFDEDTTVKLIEDWSPGYPGEVRYKVRHRLERIGIGTVIYMAKLHGYKPRPGLYKDSHLQEQAGLIYKGLKYRLTQSGNAERFVDAHKHHVRYCVEQGQWYIWDGKRLALDTGGMVSLLARDTFREIIKEAADLRDAKQIDLALKWAKSSESRATIDASLDLAHRGTEITVNADQLDAKPTAINLENGIFDLETMTMTEHDISELHTKVIPISYDENAECPHWMAFLTRIFDNDIEVINFIQQAVGYTLSALTSEECLFFCYGSGQNGKSMFISVLDMLLGGHEGYAFKAKNDLVMMRRGDPGVPMDIAELRGRRLVYTDELPDSRRFDESKIKDITSHDKLNGRFLYEKSFTFQPSHKLWMYGNHRPIVTGQDEGIWRRIRMIPFTVKIPDSEKRPPEELKAEFQRELPGILRWAIDGFYHWRANQGFSMPSSVKQATEAYRTEMDTVGAFIAEEVLDAPGSKLEHKVLYQRYEKWSLEQGIAHKMTSRKLSRHLLETKNWPSELDRKEQRIWLHRQLAINEQGGLF